MSDDENPSPLERFGIAMARMLETWFPDAFVFALIAVLVALVASLAAGGEIVSLVRSYGKGFWSLIPFTMQMSLLIIGGYVLATTPAVAKVIDGLASVRLSSRSAVAYIAFISMTSSLLSYGFSLIFTGLLAREMLRRYDHIDYRAAGAAAYLGLGSIWALGLSSSAALLMNTAASLPPALADISGVIPLSRTLFTWQNGVTILVIGAVSLVVAYVSAPTGARVRTLKLEKQADKPQETSLVTGKLEWLETTPALTIPIVALGAWYLVDVLRTQGIKQALDLNTYNFAILMLGLALHWTPRSLIKAVNAAVPSVGGVILQFPFYGGVFGLITGSPLTHKLAAAFVAASTTNSYPVLVAIYSAVLGLFIPSGGSKWIIEAPYVLQAAKDLGVDQGWVVQIYNAAEALPNLVNPFWMLPILGLLAVKARELVGYAVLQLVFIAPVVLTLMWLLAKTF
ncbi:MAG: short-chain fatty acid transporter [Myxococcota bacterium]